METQHCRQNVMRVAAVCCSFVLLRKVVLKSFSEDFNHNMFLLLCVILRTSSQVIRCTLRNSSIIVCPKFRTPVASEYAQLKNFSSISQNSNNHEAFEIDESGEKNNIVSALRSQRRLDQYSAHIMFIKRNWRKENTTNMGIVLHFVIEIQTKHE